ncbi:MAG: EAL domain-containing protein [Deltaproteobacteria bacterium]|nr:EAL domain-containing protein [Deltaproteobacteria bacterium]
MDDELPILEVIRSALTRQGHTVTTAFSGEEAVAIIDSAPVDLIISDINMSGGGGIELLQAIRTRDVDLPVILMTGAPDVESAIRCVELGAHRYLRKPFGLTELKNAVAAGLRNGRQARDARLVLAEHEAEVAVAQVINAELDRALASASMAYQPIVDRPRRELLCYEALLRTREPTFPHPGAVFAAAERLGRVADVGRWVRNRVASEMSGNPSGCVFVNVHPAELQDEHLYDPEAPLSRFAPQVVLELTERLALSAIKDIRVRIGRLRRLGFRIAIDDLGEGYAGLSSLAIVEPEVIKLDMSLVRDVTTSVAAPRLIKSMVQYASDAGAQLVAEGVETPVELQALEVLGCRVFQGYLFGRPTYPFGQPSWSAA